MADRVTDALAAGALEVVEAALGPCTVALNPFPYATSHPMVTVEVTLADGTVRHLVAKHLGRSGLSAAARRAKPAAAYDAGREPAVYADLLAGASLGTAPLVGTAPGAWPGGTVLVVGRLPGAPLTEHPAGPAWEAAARWLGRLHGTFAGRARGEVGLGRWTQIGRAHV